MGARLIGELIAEKRHNGKPCCKYLLHHDSLGKSQLIDESLSTVHHPGSPDSQSTVDIEEAPLKSEWFAGQHRHIDESIKVR